MKIIITSTEEAAMEISSKGGAALYAMQKALQQPQQMVDVVQKSLKSEPMPATSPRSDSDGMDSETAEMTGRGKNINITV